jgi:hypothetical protein
MSDAMGDAAMRVHQRELPVPQTNKAPVAITKGLKCGFVTAHSTERPTLGSPSTYQSSPYTQCRDDPIRPQSSTRKKGMKALAKKI